MAAPHVEFYATDVPTAGTRVQIANTSRKVLKVWVKGSDGNAGNVFFGDSSVAGSVSGITLSESTTEKQADFYPFDFTEAPPLQSTFWVDAANDGDNVESVFLLQ